MASPSHLEMQTASDEMRPSVFEGWITNIPHLFRPGALPVPMLSDKIGAVNYRKRADGTWEEDR